MTLGLMGGLILHLIPGRALLVLAGVAFVPSGLLLALIPEQSAAESHLSHSCT